ncbi:membrane fusion protein, Cu(I)/Ag(I) efflux system [Ferrimonas sediminum]|uniref:Membrane fusion protein, Cu(I)/Ag(I) efflux system n=1 Tax=Ferrimonas sediminum TaxID=718193 RepID=A0A1G8RLS6_9GAMM|nr:efflux RND transporter periplasmic adaptor subunit [Ferrimonas sediminum]SDJ17958.1 membrane fusion protein, Cu(I)/Ag(I) efflux system [Ferrimonas sediminum]
MNRFSSTLIAIAIGAGMGALGYHTYQVSNRALVETSEPQPLYWVAPMDPNYRRDQPGKSPMGMDLVPVYESNSEKDSPGTVTISPEVENNLGVRVATAEIKPLHSQIDTVAYVGFNEDALVNVHTRVEGWLETLYVKVEGERVSKGDPLYSIYSPALVNAQEELLLALDHNNTALIHSAKERLRALQVPEKQIQELEKKRTVSRTVTVYAPRSGVIANLNVREGFFVTPGKTIFSVGPLDEIWVTAEVFERQATLVSVGDRVTMTLEYLPGKTWEGKVDYIYPTLDQRNRTARVRLRFANPDELLKPNMFAQVTIHSDASEASLVVPREAVIRSGKQDRVVLAKGEGKFKSVEVTLGQINDREVEILDGLTDQDRVVISAQFLLDSESSISSDFLRMTAPEEIVTQSAWAEGSITATSPDTRTVTIAHKPVEAWDWPAMTMDFDVADSVEFEQLQPGTALHFEITEKEVGYAITDIHIMDSQPDDMDHNQHQGGDSPPNNTMDHSQHQGMDSAPNNAMDHSQHQGMNSAPNNAMDHNRHQDKKPSPQQGQGEIE